MLLSSRCYSFFGVVVAVAVAVAICVVVAAVVVVVVVVVVAAAAAVGCAVCAHVAEAGIVLGMLNDVRVHVCV